MRNNIKDGRKNCKKKTGGSKKKKKKGKNAPSLAPFLELTQPFLCQPQALPGTDISTFFEHGTPSHSVDFALQTNKKSNKQKLEQDKEG